jgi:hypothetical protein
VFKLKGLDNKIGILVGIVILLSMVVALAPSMFVGLTNISGAPAWFGIVLPIIVAAALILLVYRSISH